MAKQDLIKLKNKKTGEVVEVPRSQFVEDKGLRGIGNDVLSSLQSAIPAGVEMVKSIPGGAQNVVNYATSNPPRETLANLGAGGVESLVGAISAPQMLSRYLAEKFPELGKRMEKSTANLGTGSFKDPTMYESLMDFEKGHGLAPRSEEEGSVRNVGGLLFGGKLLSKLPGMLSRTGAVTAQQAGEGGDPVHAALLGAIGEMTGKGVNKLMPKNDSALPMEQVGNATPSASIGQTMPPAPFNVTLGGLGFIPPAMQKLAEGAKELPGQVKKAAQAAPEMFNKAAKAAPEMLGSGAASVLETAADYGSKIPGAAGLLQPTIGALASYIKHLSVAPEEMAQRKLFADMTSKDLPQINERMEAAKRLGLSFLTPGEAMLSPFQAAKEANIGKTTSGAKLLYEKGKQRVGTEASAINNLLDTVYDADTLAPEKNAAYEETMNKAVPDEFMTKWKQNPIVEWAINQMETKPTYKSELKDVPKNSFEYWNIVKRVISDLEKGEAKGMQGFSSNAATKIRNNMVGEMDSLEPRYEDARNIAEREFTRKDLEKVFDKKSMTLNNFWSFLKSEKEFNKVMRKLDAFPEAQQKLRDIRLLSNEIIPFDESIRSSYKLEKTGMTKDRNKLDALKRDLDERYGKEHDVASVNLMTNPDWLPKLVEYLKAKGK